MDSTDRTNAEIVLDAIDAAADPVDLSDLADRIDDVPKKSISATLTNLYNDSEVDREGNGTSGDPYRYVVPETTDDPDEPTSGIDTLFGDAPGGDDLTAIFDDGRETTQYEHTEYVYTILPDDADDSDVDPDTRYHARVNGVEPWGMFVSLTTPTDSDDVSGLVHGKWLPDERAIDEFTPGDEVGVTLRTRDDDELEFDLVAGLDTLRGHTFEYKPEGTLDDSADSADTAPPAFEDLTGREQAVATALERVETALSAADIDEWLLETSGITNVLQSLWQKDVVTCEGRGVKGDPYTYTVADDMYVPPDGADLPPAPDSITLPDVGADPDSDAKYADYLTRAVDEIDDPVKELADDPEDTDEPADDDTDERTIIDRIRHELRTADEPLSVQTIADRVDAGYRPTSELKRLVDDGDFDRVGAGAVDDPYRYYDPDRLSPEVPDEPDDTPEKTGKERIRDVLQSADEPIDTGEITDRGDFNTRPTYALKNLVDEGEIDRIGEGGHADPYRYYDPDVVTPDTTPDTTDDPTPKEIAYEYVDDADADDLVDLWEHAGVMPDGVPPDAIAAGLGEEEWVDMLSAIGDSHLRRERTRELITTLGRQVWGDGDPP